MQSHSPPLRLVAAATKKNLNVGVVVRLMEDWLLLVRLLTFCLRKNGLELSSDYIVDRVPASVSSISARVDYVTE